MHVTGNGQQIDFYSIEQSMRRFGNFGKDIEMRVAQMEDAVTVEGRRKPGNSKFQLYTAHRKCVATAAGIKRREAENEAEEIQQANKEGLAPSRASAGRADPVAAAFDGASMRHPLLVPNIIRVAGRIC